MGNSAFFKQAKTAFDELAKDGFIGDPNGQLAHAYIRVSSEEQADDNRSGLARQIMHCHEIASEKGYRVPWERVYADDDSGFEFENRPGLLALRQELKLSTNQPSVVVMEILDRLSRNADWHQGFLLDEMKKHGIEPVFWKPFSSRVERAVMGAVAQDAMELSLMRMIEGQRAKARSGRVTAKTLAYGYIFVDSHGNEGPTARRDTHYAIDELEAKVVRKIFRDVAKGKSLGKIARELTGIYLTPRGKYTWGKNSLRPIIKRPTYKGEFHAFRWSKDKKGKAIEKDDYIVVAVPAIVSAELWEAANRMLEKNKQMATRNAKHPYLLTGLLKCASCGRSFVGHNGRTRLNGKRLPTPQRVYQCTSQNDHRRKEIGCPQGHIGCKKVDAAVWHVICQVLLEPQVLIEALDRHFTDEGNAALFEQIAFLEQQIEEKRDEEQKLYRAYMAGAFDEYEYAEKRRMLKETTQNLTAEVERLKSRVLTQEEVEAQKQFILETAQQLKTTGKFEDVPQEVKQQIIKLIVNRIVINMRECWIQLEGALSGTHSLTSVAAKVEKSHQESKRVTDAIAPQESGVADDPIANTNARILSPA